MSVNRFGRGEVICCSHHRAARAIQVPPRAHCAVGGADAYLKTRSPCLRQRERVAVDQARVRRLPQRSRPTGIRSAGTIRRGRLGAHRLDCIQRVRSGPGSASGRPGYLLPEASARAGAGGRHDRCLRRRDGRRPGELSCGPSRAASTVFVAATGAAEASASIVRSMDVGVVIARGRRPRMSTAPYAPPDTRNHERRKPFRQSCSSAI